MKTRTPFYKAWITSRAARWIGLGILLLAACLFLFAEQIQTVLVRKVIHHKLSGLAYPFEDGLHAGLCGTGSPMADINRTGPCIAVVAGKHLFIVDSGAGSTRNMILMGFQAGRIDAVLLTHFHSDHIAGLGELMLQHWGTGGIATPLDIIGPEGVEAVVAGFNKAYSLDTGYRIAHHGPETMVPSGAGGIARPFRLGDAEDASTIVYDRDGVKITAFTVDHRPVVPAVGYRFDYKGRSLVVSGDTVYSPSLVAHAKNADLLLHEALCPKLVKMIGAQAHVSPVPSLKRVASDILSYHASPEDAARAAQQADVRHLALVHLIPPLPSRLMISLFLGDAQKMYDGPITMGVDGMLFSLPAGSREIQVKKLL